MKNIELVVTDLDGTVLHDNEWANDVDRVVLRELQDRGYKLAIATGQSWLTAKDKARDLGIDKHTDLIICNNGAIISPASEFNPIIVSNIETNLCKELFTLADGMGLCIYGFTKEPGTAIWNGIECPAESLHENGWVNSFVTRKIDIENDDYKDVLQLMVFVPEEKDVDFRAGIKPRENDWVATYSYLEDVPIAEFNSLKANKGDGVLELAKILNVDVNNVLTFGDNENDLRMFRKIPNSVAMGNAFDEIKKEAKYTTDTNLNAGVSKFIKENLK